MDRTSLIGALQNVAIQIVPELQSEYYSKKKIPPAYTQFCTVKSIKEPEWTIPKVGGGSAFWQTNSLIGITELTKKTEGSSLPFKDISLGFPITIVKQRYWTGLELTLELNRDFKSLKEELINWIKDKNLPQSVEWTKEILAHQLVNEGAFAGTSDAYNNSIPGIVTAANNMYVYDGLPLFTPSTSPRTNKSGTNYYTSIGNQTFSYDNLVLANRLLTAVNNKMENDKPFNNKQDNFILFNPAIEDLVKRVIHSEYIPGTLANDVNPMYNVAKPIASEYFLPTAAQSVQGWVVGNKNCIYFYDNDDIEIEMWKVPEAEKVRVKVGIDLAAGVMNWRGMVGSYMPTV